MLQKQRQSVQELKSCAFRVMEAWTNMCGQHEVPTARFDINRDHKNHAEPRDTNISFWVSSNPETPNKGPFPSNKKMLRKSNSVDSIII